MRELLKAQIRQFSLLIQNSIMEKTSLLGKLDKSLCSYIKAHNNFKINPNPKLFMGSKQLKKFYSEMLAKHVIYKNAQLEQKSLKIRHSNHKSLKQQLSDNNKNLLVMGGFHEIEEEFHKQKAQKMNMQPLQRVFRSKKKEVKSCTKIPPFLNRSKTKLQPQLRKMLVEDMVTMSKEKLKQYPSFKDKITQRKPSILSIDSKAKNFEKIDSKKNQEESQNSFMSAASNIIEQSIKCASHKQITNAYFPSRRHSQQGDCRKRINAFGFRESSFRERLSLFHPKQYQTLQQ